MPYEITFDDLPAGILAKSAREGELADIITREFTSSEDGDKFIERLDGIPANILSLVSTQVIGAPIKYSQIDHLLVVINKDKAATVYINEIPTMTDVSIKVSGKEKGEMIYVDEIAEILRVRFPSVNIPKDAGIVYLFSVQWRKALFFDFSPFSNDVTRDYDLEMQIGQYYSYLLFQNRFKISDKAWENLLAQHWFPFTSLKNQTIRDIISHADNNWDIDNFTDVISAEVVDLLPSATKRWSTNEIFKEDLPFFQRALERYHEADFVSASSILYPRIEGLLRRVQSVYEPLLRASQKTLVSTLIKSFPENRKQYSSLLPLRFQTYLEQVFFANFNASSSIEISRHSVSHGVVAFDKFDKKSATIGFLIIDQLYFHLFSINR